MTKEELEKEAGKWLRKYLLCCNCEKKCTCIDSNSYCEEQVLKAYVDSAEPREKEIKSLGERCLQLQKDKGRLTDRVRELEEKIEKMKSDVMRNVKWADQNKNEQMYCKLNAMINQWEIKEK